MFRTSEHILLTCKAYCLKYKIQDFQQMIGLSYQTMYYTTFYSKLDDFNMTEFMEVSYIFTNWRLPMRLHVNPQDYIISSV